MLTYLLAFSLEAFSVTFLPLNTLLHYYLIVKIGVPWRLTKKEEQILMRKSSPVLLLPLKILNNRLKFLQPN